MTTIISGSSPSITFSDTTTQTTAFTSTPSVTSITTSADSTIHGITVGLGAGSVATNTAVGTSALSSNAGGAQSVAVGYQALSTMANDYYNVAVGYQALKVANLATNNTGVGALALLGNTSGGSNTVIGSQAGYTNQSGSYNTFVGYAAGYTSSTSSNTYIGTGSGQLMSSGAKNTILGTFNGNQAGLDIRTVNNRIVLSDGDGNPRLYNTGSYFWNLMGGSSSTCGAIIWRDSSQTQYWNTEASNGNWYLFSNTTYTYFAQGGSSWVFSSDRRIKTDIVDIEYGLNAVMAMKPRKYKMIESGETNIGFVAQELKDIVPEAVTGEEIEFLDTDTQKERAEKTMGVSKDTLIPVLVKALQELNAKFDAYVASHP